MSTTSDTLGIAVPRFNTAEGVDPADTVEWEIREARIPDYKTGEDAFYEPEVEFPVSWSQNATNIVAQKYFRVVNGVRETSLKQVVDRIAGTISKWGREEGYFTTDPDASAFYDELRWLMFHQYFSFNSPVLFNLGVPGAKQQVSACFLLAVEDSMQSILNWYVEEGLIFKGGSGAGINLSNLRASNESLTNGGVSSGPVSFMRGADASAGTIKSAGSTRRAAKMVVLDADHPDIEQFVWCKALAERKMRVLRDAGFDMDLGGIDSGDIPYQNANNSVRLSDEFMQAVAKNGDWTLVNRVDGTPNKTIKARDLLRQIAEASWEAADPGVQFSSTINRWHTSPAWGPITTSNPCVEYVSNDNTSCNLASLRLTKFLAKDRTFDIKMFTHVVRLVFTAQDIMISRADYPTEKITQGTRAHRQIGLGYTDLGAMLMQLGLPYDSDDGRDMAASITALMTAEAYKMSGELADVMGPYPAWHDPPNAEATKLVLTRHRDEAVALAGRVDGHSLIDPVARQSAVSWRAAANVGFKGIRNSQATLLAPAGTISFFMDCDTTGIEPDLGLVKSKKLVGGGTMKIVNQGVPAALRNLGYKPEDSKEITSYILEHGTAVGAPILSPEHLPVFACAMAEPIIDWSGHVRMIGAVQPFLSGSVSKTVNIPESATVEDMESIILESWKLGLKAVSVYRDGSKVGQPLSTGTKETVSPSAAPIRRKLPRRRKSGTISFRVGDAHGYLQPGEYEDGSLGEIFVKVAKAGSTLGGILDAFAIQFSHSLQYGAPLGDLVDAHMSARFEPNGITDDPEIRTATSIIDYVVRRLAVDYLPFEERLELGIVTVQEASGTSIASKEYGDSSENTIRPLTAAQAVLQGKESQKRVSDRLCNSCGGRLVRAGSCFACEDCGTSTGCG